MHKKDTFLIERICFNTEFEKKKTKKKTVCKLRKTNEYKWMKMYQIGWKLLKMLSETAWFYFISP